MQGQIIPATAYGSRARAIQAGPARPRASVAARAGLLPWVPFWLGLGIGAWFALPYEPGLPILVGVAILALLGIVTCIIAPRLAEQARLDWGRADLLRLIGIALFLTAIGFLAVAGRSWQVAAPVLDFRYYGAVEGRVVGIDRSSGDRIRLTLDQVVLDGVDAKRMPERVRISLFVTDPMPVPGQRVMLTANLGPPNGPSEPGAFDFRRMAWFARLGAVGYSRTAVMTVAPPEEGGMLALHRLRMRLSQSIMDAIGGQAGAVSSALMTGDRSAISEATNEVMRSSGLYHIISISGLHMSMLAGFVYAALRLVGVAVQMAGASVGGTHKWAAAGALLASLAYLWLSGGGVATERSFIMVAVMLCAIMADRRAVSLRTVALAAAVLLVLTPEALTSAGFHMSFAATIALILSQRPWMAVSPHVPWWLRGAGMLLLSSLIAGLATTPFAAANFGRMSQYSMLANMMVVPVVGAVVMPAGAIAALLAPLGLAQPALWFMGLGTKWMLWVAEWVSGLNGAVAVLPAPPAMVLPLMGVGSCLAVLSPVGASMGRKALWAPHKLMGGALLFLAAFLWLSNTRPLVLVSAEGDAVGVMTPDGRAMSRPKGGSFAVSNWLEADGDIADQVRAASRPSWQGDMSHRKAVLDLPDRQLTIHHLSGKRGAALAPENCRAGEIVVSNSDLSQVLGRRPACTVLDPSTLRRLGGVAIYASSKGYRIESARDAAGQRVWTGGQQRD